MGKEVSGDRRYYNSMLTKHPFNSSMHEETLLSVAAAILAFPVLADEGMWLLPLLKQQKFAEMQALGLRLSDQEVYSAELLP